MLQNIRLFLTAGEGRGLNDMNNRLREDILCVLHQPPEHYIIDNEYGQDWAIMSLKWNQFLKTLCPHKYDSIEIKKIANRKSYDLEIQYKQQNQIVHSVIGEYKHNSKSISKLPQYYSASEKKGYISTNYAEYFYDTYLDAICEKANLQKPEKTIYLNSVYQHDYSVHPFFESLKKAEETLYTEKQKIVQESIKEYLSRYGSQILVNSLTSDLQQQSKKTFILWDLQTFHADTIDADELTIEKFEGIKRNNTVVVVSKSGTKHNMLLRWRNHLGVLFPAWQISLDRSARRSQALS
jgi:hypothetical protein